MPDIAPKPGLTFGEADAPSYSAPAASGVTGQRKMSAPHHLEDPPFWPWIVLIIGFGALGIGTVFVLSRLLLVLNGH